MKELGIDEGGLTEEVKGTEEPDSTAPDTMEGEESQAVQNLSMRWAPLDLCFGIPLFNDEANRDISQKVCHTHIVVLTCTRSK